MRASDLAREVWMNTLKLLLNFMMDTSNAPEIATSSSKQLPLLRGLDRDIDPSQIFSESEGVAGEASPSMKGQYLNGCYLTESPDSLRTMLIALGRIRLEKKWLELNWF
ncbi:hypothetical protein BWQ96_05179 [Gracilariopsis chorda]|uniref:Uncharacterized protein n=1 Tax=Gracilariopsis chorda TaxID=448386 RepID=A0A2V3ICA3_9FLOR|nr:hypothetical protein BWQ96_10578 [Gracilariopsis chorda]PXF45077.1 hypothetical protein BWQ96_05179 [Gracilariopsis chorda]|eukprot:PXF39719.1 hypothetical protein BWQ96_10578 [Gracilariopsis chorda]